jgi:hypothetical protein
MAVSDQTTPQRVRLSLDISPKIRERLDELTVKTEAGSITEVVKRALTLLDLVTEHQAEGGTLIFKHADGTQETLRIL